jgi:hypothetical protein
MLTTHRKSGEADFAIEREWIRSPPETAQDDRQALAAKVAKAEARANAKLVALAHAIQAMQRRLYLTQLHPKRLSRSTPRANE